MPVEIDHAKEPLQLGNVLWVGELLDDFNVAYQGFYSSGCHTVSKELLKRQKRI